MRINSRKNIVLTWPLRHLGEGEELFPAWEVLAVWVDKWEGWEFFELELALRTHVVRNQCSTSVIKIEF